MLGFLWDSSGSFPFLLIIQLKDKSLSLWQRALNQESVGLTADLGNCYCLALCVCVIERKGETELHEEQREQWCDELWHTGHRSIPVLEHAWTLRGEFVLLNLSCLLMCKLPQSLIKPWLQREQPQQNEAARSRTTSSLSFPGNGYHVVLADIKCSKCSFTKLTSVHPV